MNVPSPLPVRITNDPESFQLLIAKSSLPSWLKSAAVNPTGLMIVGETIGAWKVPSPLPSREIDCRRAVVGKGDIQLAIVIEVADSDAGGFGTAGAGDYVCRTVDALAVIEQHAQAAVAVRGQDVQPSVASEVSQRHAVGLLCRPRGIVDRRFEFSVAAAEQHRYYVALTPTPTIGRRSQRHRSSYLH